MAQEFFINSSRLEDKVKNLLPSQGGAGAGFDLSASTQIIPIIDLTESAEGSELRADLQSALSFSSVTFTSITGSTETIINNTGYWRVFGQSYVNGGNSEFFLSDGVTDTRIFRLRSTAAIAENFIFDFIVKLAAGESLKGTTSGGNNLDTATRQLATIAGELVDP